MLNGKDQKLWRMVARTVQPLFGRSPFPDDGETVPTSTTGRTPPNRPVASSGRLDLHGLTLEVAHRRAREFLEISRDRGYRRVEIITGRSGEIRREFPHWCETREFAAMVQSISRCPPSRGGEGAFTVTLRRP